MVETHIITHINWLTEILLGEIALHMKKQRKLSAVGDDSYHFITGDTLTTLVRNMPRAVSGPLNTNNFNCAFLDDVRFLSLVPALCVKIGACIAVKHSPSTLSPQQDCFWFPVNYFLQISDAPSTTLVAQSTISGHDFNAVNISTLLQCNKKQSRVVVRRYVLQDEICTIFPAGYFFKIFAIIKSLFTSPIVETELKHFAMKLNVKNCIHQRVHYDVELIVSRERTQTGQFSNSFIVILSTIAMTHATHQIIPSDSYAMLLLRHINFILLNISDNISSEQSDTVTMFNCMSSDQWIRSVILDEFCLHPIMNDGKYQNSISVDLVKAKLLNGELVRSVCENYYGVCGELSENSEIFELMISKLNDLLVGMKNISEFMISFRDDTLTSIRRISHLIRDNHQEVTHFLINHVVDTVSRLQETTDEIKNAVSTTKIRELFLTAIKPCEDKIET